MSRMPNDRGGALFGREPLTDRLRPRGRARDELIRRGVAAADENRSSHTRSAAGLSGFCTSSLVRQRPCLYGASRRLETMPSKPSAHARANTTLPGASRCSISWPR
jgi:hypothetical protein